MKYSHFTEVRIPRNFSALSIINVQLCHAIYRVLFVRGNFTKQKLKSCIFAKTNRAFFSICTVPRVLHVPLWCGRINCLLHNSACSKVYTL